MVKNNHITKTKAKEWTITIFDFCIGISRDNIGTYYIVTRYPNIGGGTVNIFIPILGTSAE